MQALYRVKSIAKRADELEVINLTPQELSEKISVIGGKFNGKDLIFPELFDKRVEILNKYDEFLKNTNLDEIKKLFGLKELEESKQLRA